MPTLIEKPTVIEAAGNLPKRIEEFIGRVNSGTGAVSIARMKSPAGWVEPGQTPEFDEYTVVLAGVLRVESREGITEVRAGQAVIARRGKANVAGGKDQRPHCDYVEYQHLPLTKKLHNIDGALVINAGSKHFGY